MEKVWIAGADQLVIWKMRRDKAALDAIVMALGNRYSAEQINNFLTHRLEAARAARRQRDVILTQNMERRALPMPPRPFNSEVFGDPLPGRSALDQLRAREAARSDSVAA